MKYIKSEKHIENIMYFHKLVIFTIIKIMHTC